MRYIRIDKVEPGDILGKDIVDINGKVLLKASSDMTLSENIIAKIKERNIKGIYVDDEISKGINIEEAIPMTVRHMAIKALKKKDVQETEKIAKDIVDNFDGKVEIDLNRMMGDVSYFERAVNISELCLSLGKRLELSDDSLSKLVASALLADIGLIMTEEEKKQILEKVPQDLREKILSLPNESASPILGKFVAAQNQADPMVIHSVYFHKENENGTGVIQNVYEQWGIRQKYDVRDTAKIIHICSDYIDALIRENDFTKARNMIEEGIVQGKYNYILASNFLRFIPMYPIGTLVQLSNGEIAAVVKNNDGFPLCPIVKLQTGEQLDLTKTLNVVIQDIYYSNKKGKQL